MNTSATPFIAILGRQQEISLAELRAILGNDQVLARGDHALLGSLPNIEGLGGTIKLGEVIASSEAVSWRNFLHEHKNLIAKALPQRDGKINIGLSVYESKVRPQEVHAALLDIKKILKAEGLSIRTIPNREPTLNAAQIIHNKLTSSKGVELLVTKHARSYTLSVTRTIQNIDDYAKRDREKPVRDARNGMLPPKLALTMLNLAGVTSSDTVLDPFCGSGTVLMEALLQKAAVVGTDIAGEMVEAARKNTDWLQAQYQTDAPISIEKVDAQTHQWPQAITAVAAETYLGPPLRHKPSSKDLDVIVSKVDLLHRNMLKNLAQQLPSGARLCLAVPAWRNGPNIRRLPVVDDLEQLGYNQLDLRQGSKPLLYFRPHALVARDLLVLKRM